MEDAYRVYVDKVRECISLAVYLLFAAGLIGILITYRPNVIISIIIVVCLGLLVLMIRTIIKKLLNKDVLYLFDETGITDYTKPEHVIHLNWNEVAKIEVLSNYSSLQIGILGSRVLEEKEAISENIRENLMRNGNMVFYNIVIDGFLYRKKQFDEIFRQLRQKAGKYNDEIVVNAYIDPLAKKKQAVGKKT